MIVPMNKHIVVERMKKDKTSSGLILTSDNTDMVCTGSVVKWDDDGEMKFNVLVGDIIIYLKHKAIKVEDNDGKEYDVLKEEDVIGIIEDIEEGEE